MTVRLNKRLNHKELFDTPIKDQQEYLDGISTEILQKALSAFITANSDENFRTANHCIQNWLGKNPALREELKAKTHDGDTIINIMSSLHLAETIFCIGVVEKSKKSESEIEVDLFELYLSYNSQQDELESKIGNNLPPENDSNDRIIAIMLTMNFHDFDLNNFDIGEILLTQLFKSIEFFKYLEKNLPNHLELFLSDFKTDSWQNWMKKYLALMPSLFPDKPVSHFDFTVSPDEDYEINCKFLELLSLPETETFKLSDFISLRSNPLLRVGKNSFRIIYNLFLVEKLFKSVQFSFSLDVNKRVDKEYKLKDFRSDHCDKFSEQILVYKFIEKSFPKKWVHVPGEEFKSYGYDGEPDYYLRNKNKVFLFESKDVVLKGIEKQSRNFNVLSEAIKSKFYKTEKEGKIQKKAILQLLENIDRVHNKYYDKVDDDYDITKLRVYPVLIVHDRQFESLAVNHLVNSWFLTELGNWKEKWKFKEIHGLVVINIDKFILHQDSFKTRKVLFEKLIEEYFEKNEIKNIKARNHSDFEQKALDCFKSFSTFIDIELDSNGLKRMPDITEDYINNLK